MSVTVNAGVEIRGNRNMVVVGAEVGAGTDYADAAAAAAGTVPQHVAATNDTTEPAQAPCGQAQAQAQAQAHTHTHTHTHAQAAQVQGQAARFLAFLSQSGGGSGRDGVAGVQRGVSGPWDVGASERGWVETE